MKKISLGRAIIYLFLLLLLLFVLLVLYVVMSYLHPPGPEVALPRMERSYSKAAQEVIENYSEELKAVAAAASDIPANETYIYRLNIKNLIADYEDGPQAVPEHTMRIVNSNEEELDRMPQGLADALREMEQKFPECEEDLYLSTGRVAVSVADGSLGVSLLCYPGGERVFDRSEEYTRCLDMGDGWELQMFYMPKG